MRQGTQLRYIRGLGKPTVIRKALKISNIYIYIRLQMLNIHQVTLVFGNHAIIRHVTFAGLAF